ncbi:MSHA biogenesis protein MshI [Noviherbaspirillum saxi]|uniref:MSHA biogenesis protein MshI n=1 Tax=Noviherbaspirillum saxi TaxID=2320863 RepID=A0A3A3FXC3_9BURK|nr:MSHA biogenesis protein MshI [Noviherbaspirillum saxi]RJF98841.1 MSHA biogenesis protein MshI [Noviherbaspirillum saxi]
MSQQINLFNPIFLKQKKHFSAVTMAQGLGVILLGSFVVAGYAQMQLGAIQDQAASTATQLGSTKAQLAKVSADYAPRQKSKELEAQLQQVESELRSQTQTYDFVRRGGVGNTNGYAAYLRAFSHQIVDGLWLTSFGIDGIANEFELRGRALQPELVPVYISRLKKETVMQGKSFSQLTMVNPEVDTPPDTTANPSAASAQKRIPARYVEFVLKSSGVPSDASRQAGPAVEGAAGGLGAAQ